MIDRDYNHNMTADLGLFMALCLIGLPLLLIGLPNLVWFASLFILSAIATRIMVAKVNIQNEYNPVLLWLVGGNPVGHAYAKTQATLHRLTRLRRRGNALVAQYALPPGLSFTELTKLKPVLESALNQPLEIAMVPDNPGVVEIALVGRFRRKIPLTEALPWLDAHPGLETWCIGMGSQELATISMDDFPHLLVVGRTGGGKTNLIKVILESLLYMGSAKLILADLKGGSDYRVFQSRLIMATTIPELLETVTQLLDLMRERQRKLLEDEHVIFESIALVIDEFANVPTAANSKTNKQEAEQAKEILNILNTILQQGRSTNIHVLIAPQRPDADTVPGTLRANLDAVVTFHVTTAVQSGVILGAGHNEAFELPAIKGRALISQAGELQQVQVFQWQQLQLNKTQGA